jgi:acetyltransferase-like isoleucine patch superfamily enzyme
MSIRSFFGVYFSPIYSLYRKTTYALTKKCWFGPHSYICRKSFLEGYNYIYNGTSIIDSQLGYATYVASNAYIECCQIGKFSCIGPGVRSICGTHPTSTYVSSHPAFFSLRKQSGFTFVNKQHFEELKPLIPNTTILVAIGNDCWIGANTLILQGVTIGDGVIIGAGSIVTKDVEPYTICCGNPAKPIRKRFTDDQIDFLLKTQWWNYSSKKLSSMSESFRDITDFIKLLKDDK